MSTLEHIAPSPVSPLRMSEAEYIARADEDTHAEWVAGEVRFKPVIDEVHDQLQTAIKASLLDLVLRDALGKVRGDNFAMRLPHLPSLREPDVMFIASENPSPLSRTLLDGPCDMALEIVSPGSVAEDYSLKFTEYQAAGVREYWIVDPMRRSVMAYRLNAAGRYEPIAADADGRIRSSVIAGWWLQAALLFTEPLPSPAALLRALGVI